MLQGWPCPRPRTCPRPGTLPILCSAVFFRETWAAAPRWGGLAAVSAFSEKLPEAKSFFLPSCQASLASQCSGIQKRCRVFAISGGGKRSSAGKGQGLWQNGPSGALQTFPGGRNAVLGKCRVLGTVAAPPHQLPPPQLGQNHLQGHFHQLSSQQAEATSLSQLPGSILGENHQSWVPPAFWTPNLTELCVFGSQRPLRAGSGGTGEATVGEGCFSLIYSSYYLQQTEVSKNPRPSICHLPPTDKYSSLAHFYFFLAPQPWLGDGALNAQPGSGSPRIPGFTPVFPFPGTSAGKGTPPPAPVRCWEGCWCGFWVARGGPGAPTGSAAPTRSLPSSHLPRRTQPRLSPHANQPPTPFPHAP